MSNRLGTQMLIAVLALLVVVAGVAPGGVMAGGAKPEAPNGAIMHLDETNSADANTVFTSPSGSTAGAWRFISSGSGGLTMAVNCGDSVGCSGMRVTAGKNGIFASAFTGSPDLESIGVKGTSDGASALSAGIFGLLTNPVVNRQAAGVIGAANSVSGTGVLGHAPLIGVRGYTTSTNFASVGGYFSATIGTGLVAEAKVGAAIEANSTFGMAIEAQSIEDIGIGVRSINETAIDATGLQTGIISRAVSTNTVNTARGVFGSTNGSNAASAGIYGRSGAPVATNLSSGVFGEAGGGGSGVLGIGRTYGVRGVGAAAGGAASYGGFFSSTAGIGLSATSVDNFALYGFSTNLYGITGGSNSNIAVRATSNSGIGLFVDSDTSIGAKLLTNSGPVALRATNNTPATPGHFGIISDGDVLVNGDLTCSGSCVQAMAANTSEGERLLYADSSTRTFVSDQGHATLKDGRATIAIDPLFAQTVNLAEQYMVVVVPNSADTAGLAVVNKTATGFEVRELAGGKGDFAFDWRLTAVRKGHESQRLAPAPQAPALERLEDQFTK